MENTEILFNMHITRARQEIDQLSTTGMDIELVIEGTQPYAKICGVDAPSPPWDKPRYDILIAIPIAYDMGTGLDGFYLGLPYNFQGGDHNRVNGQIVNIATRQWKAVSWHYPDGKLFQEGLDNLDSHIIHCRGFFMSRGATNARV